jgi:hypothetical protein
MAWSVCYMNRSENPLSHHPDCLTLLIIIILQRFHLELYDPEILPFQFLVCGLGHHQLQTQEAFVVNPEGNFD